MQVVTSSTLTVLYDGQFWVGVCEHDDAGRYGACRVVFGTTEPNDAEIQEFVLRRWASLPFAYEPDGAQGDAKTARPAVLSHANPKRRQREARKLVEQAGVGTKAQQAISAGYEARKEERASDARGRRHEEAERRFALKQQKRKQKRRGR